MLRKSVSKHFRFEYVVPVHDEAGSFDTGRFILGGTLEPITSDQELLSVQKPKMSVASQIFEGCRKLLPELTAANVVGHRVGIRPCREEGIRIERDRRFPDLPVIAAYGAASDGFSLHQCMTDAVRLLEEALA